MNLKAVVLIYLAAILTAAPCLAEKSGSDVIKASHVPDLIETLKFNQPLKLCGATIPIEVQQVKERLEKEMLLALWDRPQVILWIKRSARFFPHIETILKEHNLPADLKYIPIIESALRPHASSSKGAVGYWQFLKGTGRKYGLRIDSQVDERRNIFKSTHAACRFFKSLYQKFDSYLLAMAAYNMGEYGLQEEIDIQKESRFFDLYLPLQTQRYVLKAMAAKLIIENHHYYGFRLGEQDLYPLFTFDRVNFSTDDRIPITLISKSAGVSFKIIKDMNPDIRGYHLNKGQYSIFIPKGKASGFEKQFLSLYKTWRNENKVRFHIVKKGESLIGIANKYNIPVSSILKRNKLKLNRVIHPGDRLIIE
jgi:membrane-bound lytic murein transglycosylase D